MESLEQALRLNNEGVNMLIQGQDRESAQTLTQALSILQTLLKRDLITPGKEEANTLTSSYVSAQNASVAYHCKAVNDDPVTHLLDTAFSFTPNIEGFSSSFHYIFNRGMVFDPNQKQDNAMALRVYTASMIFNLALLYQRKGRESHSTYCLEKAESLYRKCSMILGYPHHLDDYWSSLQPKVALGLFVASMNNLSQLYFEEGQYDIAEKGFKSMTSIFQVPSLLVAMTAIIPPESWNQIILNLLLLLKEPCLAAAA
jgi:tetratricopeptide (TPR) repeat protein